MENILPFLNFSRRIYKKLVKKDNIYLTNFIFEDAEIKYQEASDLIKYRILSDEPLMVSRLGTELFALLNFKEVKQNNLIKAVNFIKGDIFYRDWNKTVIDNLCTHTGVFPPKIEIVEKFSKLLIDDMKEVDIWGQFYYVEKYFEEELSNAVKIRLVDIEPFIHVNPWSEVLEGKTVLIIHPFEKSIISQYAKREHIFTDKRVLPNFNLKTIKAVQSLAGNGTYFQDWFEALNYMKDEVSRVEFDVAIIGCGAYGLPLAAHIKRMKKKAIHIGGATQLLFGIMGSRWENHPDYINFINNYWVKPLPEEMPNNYMKIENGCYW